MVPFGFRIACRLASWPTSRSPCGVKATTDGVVRDPSALGITAGLPDSVAAITEFVVPRSIPTAVAIAASSLTARDSRRLAQASLATLRSSRLTRGKGVAHPSSRIVLWSVGGKHRAQELAVGLHHAGQRDRVDEADLARVLHRGQPPTGELDQV